MNIYIPLPIPASIYGLVLLFAALELKVIPHEAVKDVSKFLIEIMPIMFVPAAVGLIDAWGLISGNLVQYLVLTLVSTILVMGFSALLTQLVIKKGEHRG